MGDLSVEPSMEDILSSIKRIIAEEGDGQPARGRRARATPAANAPAPAGDDAEEEVLELSDPMPAVSHVLAAPRDRAAAPRPTPSEPPTAEPPPAEPSVANAAPLPAAPIVSVAAAAATRGSLETLSRLMVKPEPGSDGSLEGLVRELLRPMLRDWLDAHLPDMVEAMVAREIARIAGQPR